MIRFYSHSVFFTLFFLLIVPNNLFAQEFIEISNTVGLNHEFPGIDNQEVGAGITIFDVNNDGWDDIFQAGGVFPSKIWINVNGIFVDRTVQYGVDSVFKQMIQGACAADFDNDGFEDLFICNAGNSISKRADHKPPVLLRNIDGKRFEPVYLNTFQYIENFPGCAWGDINNDGFVDLYLYSYVEQMNRRYDSIKELDGYDPICFRNKLFLNNHGNGFTEIAKTLNVDDDGCGLAATFSDFDNDGDVDLFLLNDFGYWNNKGNKLFRNEYPLLKFTDISDSSGFNEKHYGMGIGTGDYNHDGFMDYYLTNIGRNSFYQNQSGFLVEKALEMEIDASYESDQKPGTSWSGIFLDVENDGDLDLFLTKGFLENVETFSVLNRNNLFLSDGNGKFENKSTNSGIDDSLANRGAALFDFNHDGLLDIVSGVIKSSRSEFANLDQKIKLYKNITKNKNNWIGIKLVGTSSVNSSCIGCRVTFTNESKTQLREVDGGSGHSSQSTKILYFGLSNSTFITKIKIDWLGGESTTIKKLNAGKVYKIMQSGEVSILY